MRHRSDNRGFTVIEVLIALIVFAIGALSVAALIPAGTKSNTSAGEETRASETGAACVEKLLASPYNSATLTPGGHADPANPYPGSYYVTWNVEENQPINLCKRITVTVRWPLANSANRVRLVAVTPRANDD